MTEIDEYYGCRASTGPNPPENLAGILRVIADEIESAPANRQYDLEIAINEYVETVPESELEEMDYNDLKQLASKHGIDIGMNPSKDELKEALQA